MVILDEKCMIPPSPPYAAAAAPPPFTGSRPHATFTALPQHLLLKIVYMLFPQADNVNDRRAERQRRTLYWLSLQLRLTNRSIYIACMHVLRSTYLSAYVSLVRPPYSSDPFPLSSSTSNQLQRETQVLDLFIALKVREDVMMDDSELHLEREESFKDIFELMQPRGRLEDLVRYHGLRQGVVHTNPPYVTSTASGALPFSALSASFSSRKVGLILTSTNGKRTIVEVARTRNEKLEVAAIKLVKELKIWLRDA